MVRHEISLIARCAGPTYRPSQCLPAASSLRLHGGALASVEIERTAAVRLSIVVVVIIISSEYPDCCLNLATLLTLEVWNGEDDLFVADIVCIARARAGFRIYVHVLLSDVVNWQKERELRQRACLVRPVTVLFQG